MKKLEYSKLNGAEKAAVLLLCLGEDVTAQVFSELNDSEVRVISRIMSQIEHVPSSVGQNVVDEFRRLQSEHAGIFVEGDEFLRRAAAGGQDRKRLETLLQEAVSGKNVRPLETIAMMPPRMVSTLLENEHPQTLALILSTQKPEHTSKILSYFAEEMAADVTYRMAKIDKVMPDVLARIEEALQRELGESREQEQQEVGGLDMVVDILGRMEKGADQKILDTMETTDPELTDTIRKKMFTFNDLVVLDNRALQMVLREVNNDSLTLALKTADEELKEKIFGNISERAADMIKEDMEAMGPVRVSDVEAMQQSIVKIATKLEEEGQIVISGRGGGDELV